MDIKCILEEGLKINATCSFETLRLREDGYDRDAYRNRTQLNVEFTLGILDEETDSYEIIAKDVNDMPAEVVIPSTHEGKPVTSIGVGAFQF